MSTHWGFRCKECDVLKTWFQSSPETAQKCLSAWPHVKAIGELDPDGDIQISVLSDRGGSDIWTFFVHHGDHTLLICNEYNETYEHWKLRKDNPLSDATRNVIAYWLRGAVKGYGVRLDELNTYTQEEREAMARDLYNLSDGSVDFDDILQNML